MNVTILNKKSFIIMAKIDWVYPIEGVHGKFDKDSDTSFQGKRSYKMKHPRRKEDFSEHEKAYHQTFGEKNKEASRINKDPARVAEFQDWREKGYQSRYRYILAQLVRGYGDSTELCS